MNCARRQRCGASLKEAILAISFSGLLFGILIEFAERGARRTLLQADARSVSAGADGVLISARSDVGSAIAAAEAAGGAVILNRADLIAGGAIEDALPERAPSGRALEYAHAAVDGNTLLAASWAAGGPIAGGTALPATGIQMTGRVGGADGACPAGFICGPGLRRDVSAMLTALGTNAPDPGSMMAIRFASALEINALLLRSAPIPSRPELNRMDANLEVTGAIANVSLVEAAPTSINTGGLVRASGEFSTGGVLEGANVEIRGNLSADGDLSADGRIEGAGLVRSGGGTFRDIVAPDANLEIAGDAEFGSEIRVGLASARSDGAVSDEAGLLEVGDLTVPTAWAPWLETGNVEVAAAGVVTAASGTLGELRAHSAGGPSRVSGGFRSFGTIYVNDCPNCGTAP